jgi:hypothetical protein
MPNQIKQNKNRRKNITRKTISSGCNKSIGFDSVSPHVLKECALTLCTPLALIYQRSLDTAELPEVWKLTNVTPLFKKGSRSASSNYRPVSLTSIACKVLESIIRDDLTNHLTKNNLINRAQHGFTKNRSCTTNLLETVDTISLALANKL